MSDNKIHVPSGIGGIMRYDSEYKSRFMISPTAVVVFIVFVLIFAIALRVLLPISQ